MNAPMKILYKLLFIFLLLATPALASLNIYFAQASAGGNTGVDCADARALSTLVVGDEAPGNTIHLCGTITSAITALAAGTAGNPVTFKFETGAVMTSAAWNTTAFSSSGYSYVVLDTGTNGVIRNTDNGTTGVYGNSLASIGVDFSGSSHSAIQGTGTIGPIYVRTANSTTDNSAGAQGNRCILWSGGSDNVITGVTTHDCRFNYYPMGTTDSGVTITHTTAYNQAAHWWVAPGDINYTVGNVTYAYNEFYNSAPNWDSGASDYFHMEAFHFFCQAGATCDGLYIHDDYIHGTFGLDYTAGIFTETNGGTLSNEQAYNNLLTLNATTQSSSGALSLQSTSGLLCVNNTVIGTGSGNGGVGISFYNGTNITMKNNIVKGFNYMVSLPNGGTTFAAGGLDNNSYYDASNWFMYQGVGKTFATWKTATGQDASAITSDPNLNASYVPNAGSPVIGAGANLTSLGVTPLDTDLAGVARPGVAAWDIGAYQYVGGTPTISAPSKSFIVQQTTEPKSMKPQRKKRWTYSKEVL